MEMAMWSDDSGGSSQWRQWVVDQRVHNGGKSHRILISKNIPQISIFFLDFEASSYLVSSEEMLLNNGSTMP
jgi:hypothetical protein